MSIHFPGIPSFSESSTKTRRVNCDLFLIELLRILPSVFLVYFAPRNAVIHFLNFFGVPYHFPQFFQIVTAMEPPVSMAFLWGPATEKRISGFHTKTWLKALKDFRGWIVPEKADDAAGLAPSKEDNAFWRNSDR